MNLKEQILKRREAPTGRAKEIQETNESSRVSNMKPVWKDRHERKHGKGKRTTLQEFKKVASIYSKDN